VNKAFLHFKNSSGFHKEEKEKPVYGSLLFWHVPIKKSSAWKG